ncbi:hypothetical protein QIG69_28465, partial [Klebsiella pneumoniae]|nr:hypothetical protein [Klebsiella pneumoniae]
RKVRARLRVSPFSVLGIAVTVFLAVLVVFGYVRLYEASTEVSDLERQLSALERSGAGWRANMKMRSASRRS